jgi:hypothetical protein
MRYVELNPVRAGLAGQAWEWAWSSARAHAAGTDGAGLLDLTLWRERYDGRIWQSVSLAERTSSGSWRNG